MCHHEIITIKPIMLHRWLVLNYFILISYACAIKPPQMSMPHKRTLSLLTFYKYNVRKN